MHLHKIDRQQLKEWLPLLLVIIVGLGFRFYKIDRLLWIQTGYDDQRDVLVSKHIVDFGETVIRGPFAAGGFSILKNSPMYYYSLALVWALTHQPLIFNSVLSLITSLSIPLAFFVGRRLWDKPTGYLTALLFALNSLFIFGSRQFSQPYLLPVCMTGLLLTFTYQPSVRNICLSLLFLLLPLHFHYGILILLVPGLFWIGYRSFWLDKHKQLPPFWVLVPLGWFILLFLSWIFLTFAVWPFDQLLFFMGNFGFHHYRFLDQLAHSWTLFFTIIWGRTNGWLVGLTLILMGWSYTSVSHLRPLQRRLSNYWVIISFSISFFLSSLFSGVLQQSYVNGFLPFILVSLAVGLRASFKKHFVVGAFLTALTILLLGKWSMTEINSTIPVQSVYAQDRQLANMITTDYQSLVPISSTTVPDLGVVVLLADASLPFDGWATGGVWFHLEENFHQPLVHVTSAGVNFAPNELRPTYLYLLCDHRSHPENEKTECLQRFINYRSYLTTESVEIGSTEYFTVWRFSTRLKQEPASGYYVVYPDLMPQF